MNALTYAKRLLFRIAPDTRDRLLDPAAYWDRYTSGCDARTAINIALGQPLDAINAARGTA